MANVVLYTYWRSSASHRVRIALAYKKIAYEPVFVNLLAEEQRAAKYREMNPMGHLPCLVVDGQKFIESVAIMEMLEETAPAPPLLPSKPEDRARVRALVQLVNSGIQPLQNLAVLDALGDDAARRKSWMVHFIARGLGAFEALLEQNEAFGVRGPYAYGDTFSMADATLIPQLFAARRQGVDLTVFPRILRIDAATKDLPFVAPAAPDAQPDAKP